MQATKPFIESEKHFAEIILSEPGPVRKKVFFVISSLTAGGSERVFWLLSHAFDKFLYEITIVILNSRNCFFSMEIDGVRVIDLQTIKASRSLFKLYQLIKKEKPYAIYSTLDHINILVSFLSLFLKIPYLIGRESSMPTQVKQYRGLKTKFWNLFIRSFYKRFDVMVCQSAEMKHCLLTEYRVADERLVVIPNPVLWTEDISQGVSRSMNKRLIIVARLSNEKGHDRLLAILKALPETYSLTIAGDGPLKEKIIAEIERLNLGSRVSLVGEVSNVIQLMANHDALVLSSYTEGFPNVVLESLSVGVPVITFKVGGIEGLVIDDFNGFVIEQGDLPRFTQQVMVACNKSWDSQAIKQDVHTRFALDKVARMYQNLIV